MGSAASKAEGSSQGLEGVPGLVDRAWKRHKDGSLACELLQEDVTARKLTVTAELLADLGWDGQAKVSVLSKATGKEWPQPVDIEHGSVEGIYIFTLQGGFSDAVEDANPAVGDELRLWLKPKSTPGGATLTVAFWRDGAPLTREAKEEGPAAEAAEAATLASGLVAAAMRQAVESADGAAPAPPQQAAAKEIAAAEPSPAPAPAVVDVAALVADAAAEAVEEENEAAAQQAAGQEEEEEHGMKAIGHAIEHAFEAIEHAIVATMHKDRPEGPPTPQKPNSPTSGGQHPESDEAAQALADWSAGAGRFDKLRDLQNVAQGAGVPVDLATVLNIALLRTSEVQLAAIYRAVRRAAAAGGPRRALRTLRVLLPLQRGVAEGDAPYAQLDAVQQALEAAGVEAGQLGELEAAWLLGMSSAQRNAIHTATIRAAGLGSERIHALAAAATAALQRQQGGSSKLPCPSPSASPTPSRAPSKGQLEDSAGADSTAYAMLEAVQHALEKAAAQLEVQQVSDLELAWFGLGHVQQEAIYTAVVRAASAALDRLARLVRAVVGALRAAAAAAAEPEEPAAGVVDAAAESAAEGVAAADAQADPYAMLRRLQLLFGEVVEGPAAAAEVTEFEVAWFGMSPPQHASICRALTRAAEAARGAGGAQGFQGVRRLAAAAVASLGRARGAAQGDPHTQLCQLQAMFDAAPGLPPQLVAQFELVWLGLGSDSQWQFCRIMVEDAAKAGGLQEALEAIVACPW